MIRLFVYFRRKLYSWFQGKIVDNPKKPIIRKENFTRKGWWPEKVDNPKTYILEVNDHFLPLQLFQEPTSKSENSYFVKIFIFLQKFKYSNSGYPSR